MHVSDFSENGGVEGVNIFKKIFVLPLLFLFKLNNGFDFLFLHCFFVVLQKLEKMFFSDGRGIFRDVLEKGHGTEEGMRSQDFPDTLLHLFAFRKSQEQY